MIGWPFLMALAMQLPAQPASNATLGVLPGGAWACAPEHEAWRVADLALLKQELPKGAAAAPGLPQLEAALDHIPPAPVGGIAVCDGRTVAFNQAAALLALVHAAAQAKSDPAHAPPQPFVVDPRPMPYARLALLVGSINAGAGRYERALGALSRGLAFEPDDPSLVSESAYSLSKLGRHAEAADLTAHAIAVDTTAPAIDRARLHRGRGFALGEMGRFDEAIGEYRTSQSIDPNETVAANEIVYLTQRKAGRGSAPEATFTSDQTRRPPPPKS